MQWQIVTIVTIATIVAVFFLCFQISLHSTRSQLAPAVESWRRDSPSRQTESMLRKLRAFGFFGSGSWRLRARTNGMWAQWAAPRQERFAKIYALLRLHLESTSLHKWEPRIAIFGAESQEARNSALELFKALGKFGHHRIAAHGNTSHHVLQDVQVDRAQAAEAAEVCAVKEQEEQEAQEAQEAQEKELTQELSWSMWSMTCYNNLIQLVNLFWAVILGQSFLPSQGLV